MPPNHIEMSDPLTAKALEEHTAETEEQPEAEAKSAELRVMTVPELIRLVQTARPEALRKIDPRTLPRYIPSEVIQNAPDACKNIIEDLIFEASMENIDSQNELSEKFGQGVHAILSETQKEGDSVALKLFKKDVKKLANLFDENKSKPTKKNLAAFDQLNKQLRSRYADLQMEFVHLSSLAELAEGKQYNADIQHKHLLDDAILILNRKMQSIQHVTDIYMYVTMVAVAKEMEYTQVCIKAQDELSRRVMGQVEKERFKLEDLVSNMITRYTKKAEIEALKYSITQRLEKCKMYEVILDEEDLIRWLDTIVEASLSKFVSTKAKKSLTNAKNSLYALLQRYCELQEESAAQVASNPFIQVDPQEAIHFLIKSEEFILTYFREKRAELSLWVGSAADLRLKGLKGLERSLLRELRKNYRLH